MADWEELDWQFFADVAERIEDLPEKPGVYAIRCASNGQAKTIGRVFDVDRSGILCFGRTIGLKGLKDRLKYFCWAALGRKASHSEGRRYHKLKYAGKGFSPDDLQIGWKEFVLDCEAIQKELSWFDEYLEMFGELPPLNRKRG